MERETVRDRALQTPIRQLDWHGQNPGLDADKAGLGDGPDTVSRKFTKQVSVSLDMGKSSILTVLRLRRRHVRQIPTELATPSTPLSPFPVSQ